MRWCTLGSDNARRTAVSTVWRSRSAIRSRSLGSDHPHLCGVFGDGFPLLRREFFHAPGCAAQAQGYGCGVFLSAGHQREK
jgi:hypothetical protein